MIKETVLTRPTYRHNIQTDMRAAKLKLKTCRAPQVIHLSHPAEQPVSQSVVTMSVLSQQSASQ